MKKISPVIYNLLSKKGKEIFLPKNAVLSQAQEAKGTKINATIGEATEDNGTPMRLPSIAKNILLSPQNVFPYAPAFGKPQLREIWQKKIYQKNPSLSAKISLPVVTSGITHSLSTVGYLFVNPGDQIILTDKYWDNYSLTFETLFGATLATFNTFKAGGFDTESFKEKLEQRHGKKIVLLNFPNNPTGYTPTNEEVKRIVDILKIQAQKGDKILVICDDAYFGLVYKKDIYKESIFAPLANLHKNILAIKLDGATKEYYAWGLRVGFVTYASKGTTEKTCQSLEDKTAAVVRAILSNASHLSQSLLLEALTSPTYKSEKKKCYQLLKVRFDRVEEVLKDKKYSEFFSPLPHNSGYFMCIQLKQGLDAQKLRRKLLKNYSTGVIATQNLLRLAFSSVPEKQIKQLFENIYQVCKKEART